MSESNYDHGNELEKNLMSFPYYYYFFFYFLFFMFSFVFF